MVQTHNFYIMKLHISTFLSTFSIFTLFTISAFAQEELIAHYPFHENGLDSLKINEDAELDNVNFVDSSAYLDGNYYWDDNMGTHLQVGPITNWDPEHFRLTLDVKIDSLPENSSLPIIVLGSSWRWMFANVTKEGKIELAIDDSIMEISDSIINLENWTSIVFERDSTRGYTRLIYNNTDTLSAQINDIKHHNDLRISASHGGSSRTFKGYWRNLKLFNITDVMTSNLSSTVSDIQIYPNPVRNFLMIENNNNEKFDASLHTVSGKIINSVNINPFSRQKLITDSYPSGIYYLELKNENQRTVTKIVFQ